jgi:hypothetical protein
VDVENLVLHDAHLDNRIPTHELTRANTVLRAHLQVASRRPDWAQSAEGLRALTRRSGVVMSGEGPEKYTLVPEPGGVMNDGMAAEFKPRKITIWPKHYMPSMRFLNVAAE